MLMNNQKIVWSEGLFIKPHHLQQWDRYHESNLNFHLNSLLQYNWGVSKIEIDKDLIQNGSFSLLSFKGILVDGMPVSMPVNDEVPKIREFKEFFPASPDTLEVFLSVPSIKAGLQSCTIEKESNGNRATRYKQEFINVIDENTGQDEQQVPVAKKRLEIRFSGEDMDDYTSIKIAQIVRSQTGAYCLNDQYISPSISVSSCNHLIGTIGRIYEKLCSKSASLSKQRTKSMSEMTDFGPSDISSLWLLYTVNSHIPLLKHLYSTGKAHPESLYCSLIKLIGELKTFSAGASPKDIPEYDHKNLSKTFGSLEKEIDAYLEIVISSKLVTIPLKKFKENIYSGRITDERLLDAARVYLAVSGDFPVEEVITKVPRIVKISCLNTIDVVISAGMPGLKIDHIQNPPSSVPIKMGQQYFQLENFGEYWDRIKESRTIAIYIPAVFSGATLELFAVKE